MVGDAKRALEILLTFDAPATDFSKWVSQVQDNAQRAPYSYEPEPNFNKPQEVIKLIG